MSSANTRAIFYYRKDCARRIDVSIVIVLDIENGRQKKPLVSVEGAPRYRVPVVPVEDVQVLLVFAVLCPTGPRISRLGRNWKLVVCQPELLAETHGLFKIVALAIAV